MARIEWTCPITGEAKAARFNAGEVPTLHYGAAATKEEIDRFEAANAKDRHLTRSGHQK